MENEYFYIIKELEDIVNDARLLINNEDIKVENVQKTYMEYINIFSKVMKDKCYYTLFNFDLFSPVKRIYSNESYYNNYYNILYSDASKITPKLYLGSAFNAADYKWLKLNKIDYIVNVTECIGNYYPNEFKYFNYCATDLNNSSLDGFYQSFNRLINENKDKIIFIHCFAGKSRSASLVLYYLINEYKIPLNKALDYLKKRRPMININQTFIDEINNLLF